MRAIFEIGKYFHKFKANKDSLNKHFSSTTKKTLEFQDFGCINLSKSLTLEHLRNKTACENQSR